MVRPPSLVAGRRAPNASLEAGRLSADRTMYGLLILAYGHLSERDRIEAYWNRYPQGLGRPVPDTPGWRAVHERRAMQLRRTTFESPNWQKWRGFKDMVQSLSLIHI